MVALLVTGMLGCLVVVEGAEDGDKAGGVNNQNRANMAVTKTSGGSYRMLDLQQFRLSSTRCYAHFFFGGTEGYNQCHTSKSGPVE